MWLTDAHRVRFVCSATSLTPSSTFSKSRLDRPWPWVTRQKRCAPAASAALACSRIWSGSIIACSGVSASAKRDCAQKPQSSAHPPDFALTSEHMSVASPKRSLRACHARSTSASIPAWSSISPSARASSRVMSGGMGGTLGGGPDGPGLRTSAQGRHPGTLAVVGEGRIRVLLCDDAPGFRALLRYTLEDDPAVAVVGEADDAETCLAALVDLKPDVVLLDLSLPRVPGLDAIAAIRARAPECRIVAV